MKKILTLLFVGFIALSIKAQEQTTKDVVQESNTAVFEFVSEVIDYGKIDLKSDGVRVFKFKNTGKSPLIIEKITSSCGCTVPKKPEDPIMPGEEGEIEVKYDTNRPGGFSKMITVKSNASEPIKRLRIKGIVIKPDTAAKSETDTSS